MYYRILSKYNPNRHLTASCVSNGQLVDLLRLTEIRILGKRTWGGSHGPLYSTQAVRNSETSSGEGVLSTHPVDAQPCIAYTVRRTRSCRVPCERHTVWWIMYRSRIRLQVPLEEHAESSGPKAVVCF